MFPCSVQFVPTSRETLFRLRNPIVPTCRETLFRLFRLRNKKVGRTKIFKKVLDIIVRSLYIYPDL
jgi:hypothetical protein